MISFQLLTISRPLHPEDIINVDLTLFLDGYHGDTSATFLLSETDKAGRELVEVTQEALEVGIRACGPGRHVKNIGREIQYVQSPVFD
jgi:methionyl aminopeptidase